MENDIPQKIHAQIGIPIKLVDKTSTPQKIAKFKILNLKKMVCAPAVGKSQSTPTEAPLNNQCITNIIQIIQITGKVIHVLVIMI